MASKSGYDYAITWRNLSVSVKIRNRNFFSKNLQPYKRLIINENGAIKTGSLVVLMGPSGAGKSTLMGALAYRNANDVFVEGDVTVNGAPIGSTMHRISGFMHQEDLFVATLTVREHLEFMAKLKLGGVKSQREINRIVDSSITDLGLTKCTNTRIGSPGDKNAISGGERKRLAFAAETLTDPLIFFCDEPTTGLDSFSAQCLVTQMTRMASRGKTILCTIHQPSSELFAKFHELILLANGRIVFIGRMEAALRFFKKHGYACPPNYNPAEVIIRALSTEKDNNMSVKRLCDEFSVSEVAREMEEAMLCDLETSRTEDFNTSTMFGTKSKGPSWMTKICLLTRRSFLQVLRDPSVQTVRMLQKLGIALMAGLCFLGTIDLSQAGVQSMQGAIFVLVTENTFPPMYGVLSLFPEEYPLFLREYKSNLYSPHLYYVSKLISFVPGLILEPVLFVVVAYLVSGLKRTLYAFSMTCLIAVLTTNVAAACGCFFSNAFGSVSMALAFLVPIDYTLMVTSGLFIKLSSVPAVISWFQYLSWFMYANEALSIVQWNGVVNITCEFKNPEIPCLENGAEVLHKFDFSASDMSQNITAMSILYFIFHALAYFFLWWRTNKS